MYSNFYSCFRVIEIGTCKYTLSKVHGSATAFPLFDRSHLVFTSISTVSLVFNFSMPYKVIILHTIDHHHPRLSILPSFLKHFERISTRLHPSIQLRNGWLAVGCLFCFTSSSNAMPLFIAMYRNDLNIRTNHQVLTVWNAGESARFKTDKTGLTWPNFILSFV